MLQENPVASTEAPIAYLMKNYVNYNLWANTTLVNWLRTKPADLLEKVVPSSFPSVRLTLLHMWQTECYWYSILKKAEFKPTPEFAGTMEDVFTTFLEQSSQLARLVHSMTDERIRESTLIVSQWFRCDFMNFEYIMQVVNHSTYHRGQVTSIGRNLGFTDGPMTDYNFYNIYGKLPLKE
jgi:uncharacterized damage-inducible protein DinB